MYVELTWRHPVQILQVITSSSTLTFDAVILEPTMAYSGILAGNICSNCIQEVDQKLIVLGKESGLENREVSTRAADDRTR